MSFIKTLFSINNVKKLYCLYCEVEELKNDLKYEKLIKKYQCEYLVNGWSVILNTLFSMISVLLFGMVVFTGSDNPNRTMMLVTRPILVFILIVANKHIHKYKIVQNNIILWFWVLT